MVVELLLGGKGRAVDALHRDAVRVAAPVGAGRAQQPERGDRAERLHVAAAAHVGKAVAVAVERDHLALELEFLEVLRLQLVAQPAQLLRGRRRVHLDALERQPRLRELAHLLLDAPEVLRRERVLHHEVVVEAVVRRRAEAELRVGEQLQHRGGAQVRGRVAQHVDRLRALLRDDADARVPRHALLHRAELVVEVARDRGARQAGTDLGGGVGAGGVLGDLDGVPVGQGEERGRAHEEKRLCIGAMTIPRRRGECPTRRAVPARPRWASRS